MEFKKLLGNRVYLELPKKDEENKIIVDENTKEALKKELLKKINRLKVYAVGTGITEEALIEGVEVLVDPMALKDRATVVPLGDDKEVLLISIFDIVHIW